MQRPGIYDLEGLTPDTEFKAVTPAGRITMLDRNVQRPCISSGRVVSRSRSSWFFGRRKEEEEEQNASFMSRVRSEVDLHQNRSAASNYVAYETHPQQFACTVASKGVRSIRFETRTLEEKDIWCKHIRSVLDEHCGRSSLLQDEDPSRLSLKDLRFQDTEGDINLEMLKC